MIRKKPTFYYCARCRITTPHESIDSGYTCTRCGSVKSAAREVVTGREKSSTPVSPVEPCTSSMTAPAPRLHWN